MFIATASWGLHVAALALAPMSVIQVSLAAGVVFIAVMAERMFGFEVGRRQWMGLMLTAAGWCCWGSPCPRMHGAHSHFSSVAMISFEAGLFGLGGLLLMGPRMGGPVEHHGVMLGAAAGHPVRRLRHLDQGAHRHHRRARTARAGAQPVAGRRGGRLDRRLLRLRPRRSRTATPCPVIAVTGTAANIAGIAGGIIVFGDPMAGSAVGVVAPGTRVRARRSSPPR